MIDGITITDAIHDLSDPNAEVRYQAAWALQYIGDASAVTALLGTIGDVDMHVRVASAQALGRIGAGRAVNALLKLMNHAAAEERYTAAVALGRIQGLTAKTPPLSTTLTPSEEEEKKRVIEALRVAMRDDDVYVRCAAALSLVEIGGFTIALKVLEALSREEVKLREAAVRQVEKQVNQSTY